MRTVFFDVDTQIDFLYPAGGLYVPGAERIIPNIAKLNHYAGSNEIPLVSSMDAHSENDTEFLHYPPHCIAGTLGQRKPIETLLGSQSVIPARHVHFKLVEGRQIILQKRALDCFSNLNLPALLDQLEAERYIVYGVVTEICVKYAADGLLKTGKPVELVTDAVRSLSQEASERMLQDFTASGGLLTSTAEVLRR
jgi:nicotinamidase/pyrazinamidase